MTRAASGAATTYTSTRTIGCRMRLRWRFLAQPLNDRDVGLTAAFAHRLQAVTAAGALELVQHRRHQTRAGRAERVTERDRAAVHIHLGEVGAGFLLPGEDDRCECLVDLDKIDVVDGQPGLLQ